MPSVCIPLLATALTLAAAPGGASPDPYPVREGIDVQHYRFELALSDTTDAVRGRATVTVDYTRPGVRELPLDLGTLDPDGLGMRVTAVRGETGPLAFTHEDDVLTITLPATAAEGSRASYTVEYGGVPAGGLRIGPNEFGERTFFSDNWPDRAREWLPTIDHIAEKATVEMLVTAPAHYQVVSNGLLVESTDLPGGRRLSHWRQSVPISPWLFVVGAARFAVQRLGDFEGREVTSWVYARTGDAGFHDFAEPTMAALHFFERYVGPFAYEKLANVESPATGGGMEAATALMYGEDAVTGERRFWLRNAVAHEIAHQWFGNAVTEASWDDVWLSEGFATYFTLLFREHAYGREDFVAGLEDAAERVWDWYDENPGYRIVHDDLRDMSRVTSIATYQKGAWVLHMLRKEVGDRDFRTGIRAYYAAHVNGTATTADFRRAMEDASGQGLRPFFDQWLRRGGNPRLEGTWSWDPDASEVTLELRQTQPSEPFALEVEVGVYGAGDALPGQIRTVELNGRSHRVTFEVDREPERLELDPDRWLLFRRGAFERRR